VWPRWERQLSACATVGLTQLVSRRASNLDESIIHKIVAFNLPFQELSLRSTFDCFSFLFFGETGLADFLLLSLRYKLNNIIFCVLIEWLKENSYFLRIT